MTSKTRSVGGCWTCRLRRKKCDEAHPVCNNCATLEIDCLYSNDKPEWMDGGERQRQRAEWLKSEVKRKAAHRRERRDLLGIEVRLESLDTSLVDQSDIARSRESPDATPPSVASGPSSSDDRTRNSTPASDSSTLPTTSSLSVLPPEEPPREHILKGMLPQDRDAHLTMMYLDYVFPFMFPFYRPSALDVGRGWLLALLTKEKALFHAALGMGGYFYGVILSSQAHDSDSSHECLARTLEELHNQQGLALRWLQHEMQEIITRGVKGYLAEASRVMASIIQLLTCEVAIAKPDNWVMHLGAATELYDEIMKHHGMGDHGPCFMMVLLQLGSRPFSWTPKTHPWGLDQAIMRFFTAQLLFIDTVASTTLQQPPRLHRHHQFLLCDFDEETKKKMSDSEKEQTIPHINLEEFVGVQNWVILAIGEIAALDAWKQGMKRAGSLSVAQLVSQATAIEHRLRQCLQTLPDADVKPTHSGLLHGPRPILQYSLAPVMHDSTLNTRIWAQGALIYLGVVLSGWQPATSEIRDSVSQAIELLSSLPNPDSLRTVVWPFVVAGCLAAPGQVHIFRQMANAMGSPKPFGTLGDGLSILEYVWAHRSEIDNNPDQWDVAACFNCLGRPALLI